LWLHFLLFWYFRFPHRYPPAIVKQINGKMRAGKKHIKLKETKIGRQKTVQYLENNHKMHFQKKTKEWRT